MARIQWLPKAFKVSNLIVLNPTPLTVSETAAAAGAVGGMPGARRLVFSASSGVTTATVNTPVNADGFVRVEMIEGFRVVPDEPDEKPPGALVKYFATASGSTATSVGVSLRFVFAIPPIRITASTATAGPSFDGVAALFTTGAGGAVELARASISDGIVVPPAPAGRHLFSSLGVSPAVPLNFEQTYFLAAILNASASCNAVAVLPSHVGAETMASAAVDGSTAARDGAYPTILLTVLPIIPPGGAGDEEDGGGN